MSLEHINEQLAKCDKLTELTLTSDVGDVDEIDINIPRSVTNLTTNYSIENIDLAAWDNMEHLTIAASCIQSLVYMCPKVTKSISIEFISRDINAGLFMKLCDDYYYLDIRVISPVWTKIGHMINLDTIGDDLVERFNLTDKNDFGDRYLEYVRKTQLK